MYNVKIEKEYSKKYGDIPKNDTDRILLLLSNIKNPKKYFGEIFKRIEDIKNIKWLRHDFTIYLLPKATPRPRYNNSSHIFYVKGAKDNRDLFYKFIDSCGIDVIKTPCKFTCISYLPIPFSMNIIERILAELGFIRPITKPDWDNLGKTYSDMIQGSLLFDDALIVEGTSKKFYSIKPRIEISIEYMERYDSIYNENKIRKKV